MPVFRKSTIKDVASHAGVSTTTVSLFVNGNENVCASETADRIREAIGALHYTPSSLTRGLRKHGTTTIGVCMANPLDPDLRFGSSFLEHIWRGILREADVANYSVIHYPVSVREGADHKPLLDGRADGILMELDKGRAARLAEAGMPTILLAREMAIPPGCGAVWADETETVNLALDYLYGLGHRRIAHVAGPIGAAPPGAVWSQPGPDSGEVGYIAVRRHELYAQWMQERGLYNPSLIATTNAWFATNAQSFLSLWRAMPNPPTAVFCANDAQAVDVVVAAQAMGWQVPDQLSVVGVDNSHQARDCDPALTSIDVPIDEVGRESVKALLRLMRGEPAIQCRCGVSGAELMIRRSATAVHTSGSVRQG